MSDVKRLLEEATPLPWTWLIDTPDAGTVFITNDPHGEQSCIAELDDDSNAALIVYAVNRLPDYEAAVDALAAAIPFMEDEWIGTEGPIGDGGEWIAVARAALKGLGR